MMFKYLISGALCTALAMTAHAAPAEHAHHNLLPHCHCPKGFAFLKGQCVTEATTPKQPICPYQKSPHYADICLKPIPAKNGCPEGFSLVPKVGCVKDEEAQIEYECPKGFFVHKDHCERVFDVPRVNTCPDPATFLQDDKCVEVKTTAVTPVCQGTEATGKCFLVQTGDNSLECPVGCNLVGKQCEKVEFAQKVYVCHWHYKHVFDKTADDHLTKKCPKVVAVPCEHQHRKLAPEDEAEGVEAGLEYAHGNVAHGHGHSHGHSHGKAHTHQCTKTEYYPAKGRCPRGFIPVDAAAQKYIHSHHYVKKEKPQCYKVEIVAPEIVCGDKMIQIGAEPEAVCSKIVQVPFDLECDEGASRVGKTCVEIVETTPVEACPPFAVKEGSNRYWKCKVYRTLPAKLSCPAGFELKGKQCLQLTIVKPHVCPSFAIEKHGNCFVKVEPIYKCPKGFQPSAEDASLCVSTKTQAPICEHQSHAHAGYPWVNNSFPGHY